MSAPRIEIPASMADHRSSLLAALIGSLRSLGDDRDAAWIAGLSGLAFRLHVDATVSPASVSWFPWQSELPLALSRLGYDTSTVFSDDSDPRFDAQVDKAVRLAETALASGRPAILWGVHLPEFGIVRGSDPARAMLLVSGVLDGRGGRPELPSARLGRGDVPALFLTTLGPRTAVSEPEAAHAALLAALRLAHGVTAHFGDTTSGLAAYATWRTALERGTIDPAGHAFTAQVTCELRALAPVFLRRVATLVAPSASQALSDAAGNYARAADALVALASECPFPLPEGETLGTRARARHAELLGTALAAEEHAVAALERALVAQRHTRVTSAVRIARATTDDASRLFRCIGDLPLDGLEAEAAEIVRAREGSLGTAPLYALLALCQDQVVGHVYYADLPVSGAAIDTVPGRFLYVYCMWVAVEHRRAGIGKRLIHALEDHAREMSVDGVLCEATAEPIFLHHAGYEALGFGELDRTEDDARLLYLPVLRADVDARMRPPEKIVPGRGLLPVIVSEGRPCPLLLRSARNLAAAALACQRAGAPISLDERQGGPHGVEVGGRRLPLGYLPREAAETALAETARAWQKSGVSGHDSGS
jgi:ribosomal protein S18 acetylase RimI-like enzyme